MKAQNPGMDSLSAIDWRGYLEGSEVIQFKELPPLAGILTKQTSAESTTQMQELADRVLLRNSVIAGGILLFGLVVASNLITRVSNSSH